MNFEQLNYIVEIAKSGSLSQASDKLYISQSALSQSITSLENELGVQIFNRSRLGVTPTETGNNIIEKAKEILDKAEELKREADISRMGKLKIGTVPSPLTYLPNTLLSFKKDYPNIQVEVTDMDSRSVIENITQHTLDIGVIRLDEVGTQIHAENIEYETILYGKWMVVASKQSTLASLSSVTPQDIRNHTLAIFNDETMQKWISDMKLQFGEIDILFATNNLDAIRSAVSQNLAITIAPDYAIRNDPYLKENTVSIEIANFGQNHTSLALVWSSTHLYVGIIRHFISWLKSMM